MTKDTAIKLFEDRKVRSLWDADKEKWYISIVDVIAILTDQLDHQGARNYWKVLKHRLSKEGSELVTVCNQLKMLSSDGKFYKTDVADTEQLFRLIQSIPSPKTEPFKLWLAEASTKDISQAVNPETFEDSKKVAKQGGNVAKVAMKELEAKTGKKVVTALNAKDTLKKLDSKRE